MTDSRRPGEPATTAGGGEAGDRAFTAHPTGATLAEDLREVKSKPERAFNLGAALGLTLAVATFVFLVQNSGPTDFEWLWFDFELPLWAALVGALVTGALLVLTALAVHRRRRKRIGRRDRAAGRLEQALVGDDAGGASAVEPPPAGAEPPHLGSASASTEAGDEPRVENEAQNEAPRAAGSRSAPTPDPGLRRPSGPDQVRGPMQG